MMVDRLPILIVEDDDILATNLVVAVEDRDCGAVGPVATAAAALATLATTTVGAAILDASLLDGDVTPVAMELIDRAIPFLIYTGIGLPAELEAVFPHVSVIMKPTDPDEVVLQLLDQLHALSGATRGEAERHFRKAGAARDRALQIEKIVAALFDQFGAKAVVLARRQASESSGDALTSWSAIIDSLENRSSPGR